MVRLSGVVLDFQLVCIFSQQLGLYFTSTSMY